MTKQCSKCQKVTNGIKVDKGIWLCWECFQEFYSQYQPINTKDVNSKHKKAVKEFLK
jgi:ribosomal protein L37AE/L43A